MLQLIPNTVKEKKQKTKNKSDSESAGAWCTGKIQRDQVERAGGGGIGMGNTCKSMADSCQCMTKTTTIL